MICFSFSIALGTLANAADLVISNANIVTLDNKLSKAQSIAIENGKIIFIGNNENIKSHIQADTKKINLNGKMVLPGFIDIHNHVFEVKSQIGGDCLLREDKTLKQQIKTLKRCKDKIDNTNQWLIGSGFQLDKLIEDDPDVNPRVILDSVFPDNPVIFMEQSSHAMIVNSLAYQKTGIDKNSINPQGGIFMKTEQGELNGILFDNAGDIVYEKAVLNSKSAQEKNYRGLLAGLQEVARNGITTIGDGRLYWRRGWVNTWQRVRDNEQLTARVSVRPWVYPEQSDQAQFDFFKDVVNNDLQDLLLFNQVKMYSDGVLHFSTAKMIKPYRWYWHRDYPRGLNYIDQARMKDWLIKLYKIGYGAHIHAVGDAGVKQALDAIAAARNSGSMQRYTLTHLELVDESDIKRFHELKVYADYQAGAKFFVDTGWADYLLGAERTKKLMPMRKIHDSGGVVTFSSDWDVNALNPLFAIANSLRLKNTKGLPTIYDALKAATINGAMALGIDEITGSIELGKSADFVVLDNDITKLKANQIVKTKILMTLLKGKVVYDADN